MEHFVFFIDTERPGLEPGGYVRAAGASEAFETIGRTDATLVRIPEPFQWPGPVDAHVIWEKPA